MHTWLKNMLNDSVYILCFFVFLKEQEKALYKPFRSFFYSVPKIIFEFLANQYGISTNLSELLETFIFHIRDFDKLDKFSLINLLNSQFLILRFLMEVSHKFWKKSIKNEITFCTVNRWRQYMAS